MHLIGSRFACALLVLSLSSNAAIAALSSASHPIFGPSSLTKDPDQGLYWLTPNATVGLSFTEVSVMLSTDVRFAGFRVASLSELGTLYAEAGIPDINVPGFGALYGTTENVPGVEFLQSLTGITYHLGAALDETAGFVGDSFVSPVNGFLSVEIGNVALRHNVPTRDGPLSFASAYTTWGSLPVGTQSEGVGTWLVSPIPEPETYAMLLAGLGLLGFMARRREESAA